MSAAKRVLIVDDEPDILKSVVFRVKKAGYDTITAADGQEALDKAASAEPDLIILDWKLPLLNGGEVYQKLKEDERLRNIPVIFLTASSESKQSTKSMVGISEENILLKPYEPAVLISRIKKLIG